MTCTTKYMTTGEVARAFAMAEGQIGGVLRRTPHIRPLVVRGRRCWTQNDVAALAKHLGQQPKDTEPAESETSR